MQRTKGFTLIELVVVIAILGILAAVALPRFINATEDAHEAAVRGTAGALATAVLLARSQYEVNRNGGNNGCAANNCQIDVAGFGSANLDVNANGWPIGISASGTPAASTAMSAATCVEVFQNVLQGSAPTIAAAGSVDYVATAATTVCTLTYQNDGADDTITYDASNGAVLVTFN